MHYVDFGGPAAATRTVHQPPVVLVHGLGGSHLNWVGIGPQLARHRRVVALDLAGFGLTPSLGRSTSVHHNAALLSRFIHRVLGRPVVLVGNSMGGMVALLLADRRPEQVVGLGLIDPSLPIPRQRQDPQVAATFALYAVPRVGEAVLTRYNAATPTGSGCSARSRSASPTRLVPTTSSSLRVWSCSLAPHDACARGRLPRRGPVAARGAPPTAAL